MARTCCVCVEGRCLLILQQAYCDQARKVIERPSCHLRETGGEVYYVKYKDELHISGEFLKVVSEKNQLGCVLCQVKVVKNLFFRKGSVFVLFFLCLALI